MGVAAYNRGSEAIRRDIQRNAPTPVRIIWEPATVSAKRSATRSQVKRYMRSVAAETDNPTELAESAACEFPEAQNWLDDETHWIWDDALDIWELANGEII